MGAERFESVATSFFGPGAIGLLPAEMRKQGAKRVLIVTDKYLHESGLADQIGKILLQAGLEYAIYYLVRPNPTVEVVEDCITAARSLAVDWLVAVGGGSAIDTAKAAAIVITNGGRVNDYEGVNKSRIPGLPVAAVNTTAGTGSEVTTFYIVTDAGKHSKMCMVDVNCKVRIAVNDIQFMMNMPKSLTAATGMDAMTHAVEAALSKRATPFTDKDAYWAVAVIKDYLPRAAADPEDEKAREMMAYAQYAAGMAFSNGGLGMVHAMAHSLGGFYNLPHGVCNAILLPFVMEFNGRSGKLPVQFGKVAAALGAGRVQELNEKETVNESVSLIRQLSARVGIVENLRELKVNQDDFPALAELALKDACMADNRITPSLDQVIEVYQKAYEG